MIWKTSTAYGNSLQIVMDNVAEPRWLFLAEQDSITPAISEVSSQWRPLVVREVLRSGPTLDLTG